MSESFIANVPALAGKSVQFHPVLIVHAVEDRERAETLARALEQRGVRCWQSAVSADSDPQEFERNRHGQKLLFCISQNWLNQPVADGILKAARVLEEESSAERGLAVRSWFSADLDGELSRRGRGELRQPYRERLVATFPPASSENGQYHEQLENLLGELTAHVGRSDQASLADQALLELRNSSAARNACRKAFESSGTTTGPRICGSTTAGTAGGATTFGSLSAGKRWNGTPPRS